MMLKRSISAPFPKYDSDCEEEERVQKGIIYQYTIGIIYELPTSSSDNPLTRKRSVFCARVCPRTPCQPFFLLLSHVLIMADAMAFNNVPPPAAASLDPNSAFADALKRAKEVRTTFGDLKGCLVKKFNVNFLVRLRLGWDQAALLSQRQQRLRIPQIKVRTFAQLSLEYTSVCRCSIIFHYE